MSIRRDSGIGFLARALWVGAYREGNFVIVYSGYSSYFDASMDENIEERATVVAGYVSTVELWEHWEEAWRKVLGDFDAPYFHMNEFASNTKAFSAAKWRDKDYRADFIARLVFVTEGHTVAAIVARTEHSLFDAQNKYFELDKHLNPYALSGRDCAVQTKDFIRNELKSTLPIAFIFDRGDKGRGMLMKAMENSGLPPPIFKHARPDPKIDDPPVTELQACDLLAWEIRRAWQDSKDKKPFRASFMALRNYSQKLWFDAKEDDLLRLIRKAQIPLRPEWKHLENTRGLEGW